MLKFATRAIHVGQEPEPVTGATIPPIFLSTTFTQAGPGEHKGHEYSRSHNPTRQKLEAALASLESGEACAAFASGLAATTTLFQTLRPGDGVVAGHDLYGGTFRLLQKLFVPWGLEVAYAEDSSVAAYEKALAALKRPKMLWLETPSNPLLDVIDLKALCAVAKKRAVAVAVDNTFATPFLQRPLELGADYVVHSTTKYLGGHSDVVGGAVIGRERAAMEQVFFLQNAAGAVPGPMDCYLLHRGLKTLAIRMERHCANARRIVEALSGEKDVERVYYPGLESQPGHSAARAQMDDFGGMVSFRMKGDFERTKRFCSALKLFALAESLGGVESLCCHPATMTHASIPREIRESRGVSDTLVRLSVGIEDADDLIGDLKQAFKSA
jgi:cystathionine beta-lyase/cystathionine gamma-synthase